MYQQFPFVKTRDSFEPLLKSSLIWLDKTHTNKTKHNEKKQKNDKISDCDVKHSLEARARKKQISKINLRS